jgi:hypothetical protein
MNPLYSIARLLSGLFGRRQFSAAPAQNSQPTVLRSGEGGPTVAFFPHQGLAYGPLFRKDHFYAERKDSPLYPSRLLHIDLHNRANPDPALEWVAVAPGSGLVRLKGALRAWRVILPHVRSLAQLRGATELAMIIARVHDYARQLARFSALKVALLDHDVLFPKSAALALQSLRITTVAMQDRFNPVFSHAASLITDVYLAASPRVCDTLQSNRNRAIGSCVAVGLVRADKLVAHTGRVGRGRRSTVVALPYHSRELAIENAYEPFMNWKSHRVFLSDVLRLARALPDSDFIIRGKNCDWLALPEFSDLVAEIDAAANVSVSTEYSQFDESYRLCAGADLVIAKPAVCRRGSCHRQAYVTWRRMHLGGHSDGVPRLRVQLSVVGRSDL